MPDTTGQEVPCPYCSNISGVGPVPHLSSDSAFDISVAEFDRTVLVPTVGMLTPGYCLLVDRAHSSSYSTLSPDQFEKVVGELRESLNLLEPVFGPYLVVEHGATTRRTAPHGSCIDHSHFHLIPDSCGVLTEAVLGRDHALHKTSAGELGNLAGHGYLLVGADGEFYSKRIEELPSQWIRRRLFEVLGLSGSWDWAADAGRDNLLKTRQMLRDCNEKGTRCQ